MNGGAGTLVFILVIMLAVAATQYHLLPWKLRRFLEAILSLAVLVAVISWFVYGVAHGGLSGPSMTYASPY
jgi:hypothetical protein